MDVREEDVGEQGFEAEVDVQADVFVFGLGQAADDEDGEIGGEFAETGDELVAIHSGHEVVGEDEVDGGGVFAVAKLFESSLGTEDGDDEVTSTLEDGLTGRGLDGVVVNEKQGRWHVFLRRSC